jgi:hypothetical protein
MSWTAALSAPCLCYVAIGLLVWALPKVGGRTLAAVEQDEHLPWSSEERGRAASIRGRGAPVSAAGAHPDRLVRGSSRPPHPRLSGSNPP